MALVALVVGATARPAAAQTPTVFLHGLASGPSTWSGAASRLAARVPIAPKIPSLGWDNPYGVQANRLNADPAYRDLPASTIVVGHSNGGIVAREWSRVHPVSGIVTLGSPHGGAPIIPHLQDWLAFNYGTSTLVSAVYSAFTVSTGWSGVIYAVAGELQNIQFLSSEAVTYLIARFGLRAGLPIATDMTPGSPYFRDLNSPANLSREASQIPSRVGITSIAHNFYDAGWARAVAPDAADGIAVAQHTAEAALYGWAAKIMLNSEFDDFASLDQANSLLQLAAHIHAIDPTYCALISRMDYSACLANDGLLSYQTQTYPNAVNIMIGQDNNGPAHTQETSQSDDVLFQVFQNYMHVSPAAPPPPPPPPPTEPPPSQPPPTSDPPPSDPPPSSDRADVLGQFERLYANDVISSDDGRFHLIYQGDGNLVLYDQGWRPLWDTGTGGTDPGYVEMQGDGNLVMVNASGGFVWDVGVTAGHPGAWLIVQDDGNVVIYDGSSHPLWATNTVS
jgi:pimeloyl-ACP methyl ester carboxylesterase